MFYSKHFLRDRGEAMEPNFYSNNFFTDRQNNFDDKTSFPCCESYKRKKKRIALIQNYACEIFIFDPEYS
jgi:hypothetical protein